MQLPAGFRIEEPDKGMSVCPTKQSDQSTLYWSESVVRKAVVGFGADSQPWNQPINLGRNLSKKRTSKEKEKNGPKVILKQIHGGTMQVYRHTRPDQG